MTKAMIDPMNHAQTAVAGPPKLMGTPYVAGCDPRTPRIEMAYDTVDHFVNSRRSSYYLLAVLHASRHLTDLSVPYPSEQTFVVVLYCRHWPWSGIGCGSVCFYL